MLSTHWSYPHEPAPRQLRILDMLGRKAAELIERKRTEASLREARQRAEEASRAKSRFLAVISHEFRTPLFGVMGYARLLEDEILGPLTPRQRDAVTRITRSCSHQTEMIEEILTLSRIEAGREEVRWEEADLTSIARDAVELFEPQCNKGGLAVGLETGAPRPALVRSDPAKVRRILTNLVGNAVKYTEQGEVTVQIDDSSPDSIEIHVRDTGPRIPHEHREAVFHSFTRLHDSRPRVGGAGLGLSMCRNLARLIGAELSLHSEPGQGSTFTLRLPR